MWDLFRSEILRFRRWALAAGGVHLLLLGFLARTADITQLGWQEDAMLGGVYGIVGLLFGLVQFGSYRRPNAWLNLIHRPLAPSRIALALAGAGLALLALAIAAPTLVIAAYQRGLTAQVVDLRHWLLPLAAWQLAGIGYLAGGFTALGARRYAWVVLGLPVFLIFSDAGGVGALMVQALMALGYLGLLLASFRPDLDAPPRGAWAQVAVAVPVQFGLFFALVLAGFGLEMLWVAQGTHPNNIPVPLPGGTKEAQMAKGQDLFLAGLAHSRDPQAPLWREQVQISEVFGTGRRWDTFPTRGELTNTGAFGVATQFVDAERQVQWTFSHDRMRLEGVGIVDHRRKGELGLGEDNAPFPSPLLQLGQGWMVGAHAVYQFDPDRQRVVARATLPADETVAGAPDPAGDAVALMTDKALYLYDTRAAGRDLQPLQPRFRIAQPGRIGDLTRVDLVELLDGYLVSFTYEMNAHLRTGAVPFQQILHVDGAGRATTVATRGLAYDYPAVYRYRTWWLSPLLDDAWREATGLFAAPQPLAAANPPPVPRSMQWLAFTLMALSAALAAWRSGQTALSARGRVAWTLACAAFGPPTLAALWLIHPRREAPEPMPLTAELATS